MIANTGVATRETVIQHVLTRLKAIGVSEVFGVPGDYAFSVDDAIATFPRNRVGRVLQ